MDPLKIVWPGGEHSFALRIGELRGLQNATQSGPEEIFNRLRLGTWKVDDIIQVIRWGLVGGGDMDAAKAGALVTPIVETSALTLCKMAALEILAHSLMGDLEDAPEGGKPQSESRESGGSQTSTE